MLDPVQGQHFVWTELGPNCLKRLSADDTSRQLGVAFGKVNFISQESHEVFVSFFRK